MSKKSVRTATVGDVREIVTNTVLEASDAILSGVERLLDEKFKEQDKKHELRFRKLEKVEKYHPMS